MRETLSKPLWSKLGIKAMDAVQLVIETDLRVPDVTSNLPFPTRIVKSDSDLVEMVICFVNENSKLISVIPKILLTLKKTGSLWIIWPKKASKQPGDLNENSIRNTILNYGLVDVKVCAITEDVWSGLKFVWRLENR